MHRVFKNHKDYLRSMTIFLIARKFSQFKSQLSNLGDRNLVFIPAFMFKFFERKDSLEVQGITLKEDYLSETVQLFV